MKRSGEYRKIAYAIPYTDDGACRWILYPRDGSGINTLNVFPRPVYSTCNEALKGAKSAIDALIDGKRH